MWALCLMSAATGDGKQGTTTQEATLLCSNTYKMALEMWKHEKMKKWVDKRGEKTAEERVEISNS
jgi:hypothetical protein